MFGFEYPEYGSEVRYERDVNKLPEKKSIPWVTHRWWWIVHNCVSHPLIGLFPFKPFFDFHDYTSELMHDIEEENAV